MNRAELPPKNIALIDDSGRMSPEWYRAITDLYQFSGLAGANFPLYQDASVTAISMRGDATSAPAIEPITANTLAMAFGPSTAQYLHFSVHIGHGYVSGTNLRPYVQWAPENSSAGNVAWNLDVSWGNIYGAIPADSSWSAVSAAPVVAKKMVYAELVGPSGEKSITGKTTPIKEFSSILTCRVWRNSTAASDSYTGKAFLLSCGFHFLNAAHGTVVTWPKEQ